MTHLTYPISRLSLCVGRRQFLNRYKSFSLFAPNLKMHTKTKKGFCLVTECIYLIMSSITKITYLQILIPISLIKKIILFNKNQMCTKLYFVICLC